MERYRYPAACYDSRVRWNPVHRKIAGLDAGRIYWIAQIDIEISRGVKNDTSTTWRVDNRARRGGYCY
jgi:hypothetical protein